MAIPSREIGWGTTDNLLWQISKQLEYLTNVIANPPATTTTTTTAIPQYTYTVYIVDPLTCSYTTPVNMWSFDVITEGYYTYNGGAAVVYIVPSVHVDYTYQITSAIATTCTPIATTTTTTTAAGPTTTTTTTTLQYAYYFEIVNITGDEYTLTLNTEAGLPTTTTNYTLTKTVTTYNPSSDTVVKTAGAGSTVIEKIEKIDYDGTTVLATALVGGTSYTFGTGPFTMNSTGVGAGFYQTIRITIANA